MEGISEKLNPGQMSVSISDLDIYMIISFWQVETEVA